MQYKKIGVIKTNNLSKQFHAGIIARYRQISQRVYHRPPNGMGIYQDLFDWNERCKHAEAYNWAVPSFCLLEEFRVGSKITLSPTLSLDINYFYPDAIKTGFQHLWLYADNSGNIQLCGTGKEFTKANVVEDFSVDLSDVKLPKRRNTHKPKVESKTDFMTRGGMDYTNPSDFQVYGAKVEYLGKMHYYGGVTEVKQGEEPAHAIKARFKQHIGDKDSALGFIIRLAGIDKAKLLPIGELIKNKRRGEAEVLEGDAIRNIHARCKNKPEHIRINMHDNTQDFLTIDPNDADGLYIQALCKKTRKTGYPKASGYEAVNADQRDWGDDEEYFISA